MAVSLILAAPRIAGLLRLAAPRLIRWFGSRKRFCLASYALSLAVLALLPACVATRSMGTPTVGLIVLVVAWCVYHLLEYLGTVALWAWLGDLVPLRIRGRFLGRRERWMLCRASDRACSRPPCLLWRSVIPGPTCPIGSSM